MLASRTLSRAPVSPCSGMSAIPPWWSSSSASLAVHVPDPQVPCVPAAEQCTNGDIVAVPWWHSASNAAAPKKQSSGKRRPASAAVYLSTSVCVFPSWWRDASSSRMATAKCTVKAEACTIESAPLVASASPSASAAPLTSTTPLSSAAGRIDPPTTVAIGTKKSHASRGAISPTTVMVQLAVLFAIALARFGSLAASKKAAVQWLGWAEPPPPLCPTPSWLQRLTPPSWLNAGRRRSKKGKKPVACAM